MSLALIKKAKQDIKTGYQWYDRQHYGLGGKFLVEIEVQIE